MELWVYLKFLIMLKVQSCSQALADIDATTIIGGGDSAAAVNRMALVTK